MTKDMNKPYILGISSLYHDSAAALIRGGEIIAAAQEERFTRKKHDRNFPVNAIRFCLTEANITADDLTMVVFYDDPIRKLDRMLTNIAAVGIAKEKDNGLLDSYRMMLSRNLWIHKEIHDAVGGGNYQIYVTEHHLSHAASAFFPSPFEKSVVLTIDGVGEWATTTIGIGEGNHVQLEERINYPHSIGLLYSAFTYFCGFKVNSGDYKFMGLAPYGKPIYYDIILEKMIDVKEDGSFRLNLDYFDYYKGSAMINEDKFSELFGGGRRKPESEITIREMNIAASVQKIVEEIIIAIVRHAKGKYGKDIDNIVLAGGVALNCVANGKVVKEGIFKHIWIQPAAGDAGGALGAAYIGLYHVLKTNRTIDVMDSQKGSYLGPAFKNDEVQNRLLKYDAALHYMSDEMIFDEIAKQLNEGNVIGLCEGRMEFGPRALGNRSIIGDPRNVKMQSLLNLKIKYRESFRPFAPSVLEERCKDCFELPCDSPYMLLVADVQKSRRKPFNIDDYLKEGQSNLLPIVNIPRSDLPAITHVDYSARIQTVNEKRNPFYYRIISHFEKLTGCGVIVNTSFNVRGEPIVCTPEEAYECFMRTEMDVLVVGNYVMYKKEQKKFNDKIDWRKEYVLD